MYFTSYWTDAHRKGIGIDIFQFDSIYSDYGSLHIEILLWRWVFNISFGRRSK